MSPIDHNSPGGRLHYLLKELLDGGHVPDELFEEVSDALTTFEIED